VKTPTALLVLIFLALLVTVRRRAYSASWRDELILITPAITLFWLVSSQTGFNHHSRYVIPALPFLFVWTSKVGRAVTLQQRAVAAIVGSCLIWMVASSLWVFPHSMSYFNELAGGPRNGHAHLADSNIDWGQDLLYLKEWMERNPDARPLYLSYFNIFDPQWIGVDYSPCAAAQPGDTRYMVPPRDGLRPGWYGISVHHLRTRDGYEALFHRPPTQLIGYSIYLYRIDRHELSDAPSVTSLSDET
jgi:hypothetical protein